MLLRCLRRLSLHTNHTKCVHLDDSNSAELAFTMQIETLSTSDETDTLTNNPSGSPISSPPSDLLKRQGWWPDNWSARDEKPDKDEWVKRSQGRKRFTWEMIHNVPRTTLFRPLPNDTSAMGPKDLEGLGKFRLTLGKYSDGKPFYKLDCWK